MKAYQLIRWTCIGSLAAALLAGCQSDRETSASKMPPKQEVDKLSSAQGGPGQGKRDVKLEVVALFEGPAMPTGVTVSREGRIFLSIPRWNDKVENTVVELRDGKLAAYPDAETNKFDPAQPDAHDPRTHLISVQSVVADANDILWVLDPGSVNLAPVIDGAPKLWGYDLKTGKRVTEIKFLNDVVLKHTYLNDVRVDEHRGAGGTAFITDSGVGGIIVVDLASGASWRHLDDHPSVLPTPGLVQMTEGQPLLQRKENGEVDGPSFHSDGIALSPDGKTLYYNAIGSRDVWSVPTELLADRNANEEEIAAAVKKVATKPSGNDGLICNSKGRIYSSDFEDNCIRVIDPVTGNVQVLAQDERLLWPDTFSMHGDELYVTSNQLARQASYHFGKDERKPPYALFRIAVSADANTRVVP